jgi:class 3 adenylate cyclase
LTRLAAAVPNPLLKKMQAAAHLQGERRVVTALFVDVVGSTSLSQQVDVETWTAIMNGAFDRFAPLIYSYEGTIARLLGDSLLAFYGAPVAHEDDPIRAVRSALDLISAGREYAEDVHRERGVEFRIRVCINTGQVIIGAFQDDLQYQFTAMGGAVNLVSRIKFAAQPMTVLVSENTYPFIAPVFDCADLGSVSIKGIKEPMRVYQVHGSRDKPGQLRGLAELQSPMVGRDAELATLTQLCYTVQAGIGRVVVIVGDPGLGKTRLISEWKAVAGAERAQSDTGVSSPALLWVEGRCLSFGQGFAYHLLIDLIRSIIRVPEAAGEEKTHTTLCTFTEDLFGESAMEVYPYLGHLLSLNLTGAALDRVQLGDPQALRTQYLNAIRRLLQALSTRSPLVLVLEDLHWADPSSTSLLVELLRLVSAVPILFCLVSRPEHDTPGWKLVTAAQELMGGSLTALSLNALSETDSQKLVANLLEIEALPVEVRQTILKKSDGNPFFVEEVIRMLIDQGAIVQNNGGWIAGKDIERLEIPDNLQGLLLARIDRLPENVKHTLRVASVIGRQFPKKVLAYVLGEDGTR